MKQFVAFLLIFSILLAFPQTAFAHSVYGTTYTRSELSGWMVNENLHINSQTIYYGFADASITTAMKNATQLGASYWSPNVNFVRADTTYASETYRVEFKAVSITNNNIYASTKAENTNSSGHASKWCITINTAYPYDAHVAAHEFGHVLGLADLYNAGNKNKLMYGYMWGTASRPTTYDIKGFNVITGKHTSHSFVYARHPFDPDSPVHLRVCNTCNILLSTGNCSPRVGTCTTCGFTHTDSNDLNSIQ